MLAGRQSSESTLLTVGIPTARGVASSGAAQLSPAGVRTSTAPPVLPFLSVFSTRGWLPPLTVEEGAKVGTVLPFMSGSSLPGLCGCRQSFRVLSAQVGNSITWKAKAGRWVRV